MPRVTYWPAILIAVLVLVVAASHFDSRQTTITDTQQVAGTSSPQPFVEGVASTPRDSGEVDKRAAKTPKLVNVWDTGIVSSLDKPIRVIAHQAAVTGKVADIVAAKAMARRCAQATPMLNVLRFEPARLGTVSEARIRALQTLEGNCDGYESVQRQSFRVADAAVPPELAARLIEAAGRPGDPSLASLDARKALVDFVSNTGSIELLRSTKLLLLRDPALREAYGLAPDARFDEISDATMLDFAIDIQACRRSGRCIQEAMLDSNCIVPQNPWGACVDSLSDYPDQRMFGPLAQRALWAQPRAIGTPDEVLRALAVKDPAFERVLGGWTSARSDDALKQRWIQVNALVDKLSGGDSKER